MTLGLLLFVIGIVLMVFGSCGVNDGRVSLWNLGWPCVLVAWHLGGIVLH